MVEVLFYESESGHCYVEEYLDTLSDEEAQKVAWVIELIESLPVVPTKFLKKLQSTDGLWEIRVEYGGNIFRLIGFFEENSLLITNHGFTKKTQKIQKKELRVATNRMKEYFERKKKGEL